MPGNKAHNLMNPQFSNKAPKHTEKPKQSGVLILLYSDKGIIRFPLIQRAEYPGTHSGQMAFPGGKKEPQDQNLTQTAIREAEEEIGITKNNIIILGHLSKCFVAASNYDVLPVIGYTKKKPSFKPDTREVSEIITPSLPELMNNPAPQIKNITIHKNIKLRSPYYQLQNKIVWGATAMVLNELTLILKETN